MAKKCIVAEVMLALILVLVTLWVGSEGFVQVSSPVRAQRSIYYHNAGNSRKGSADQLFAFVDAGNKMILL